MKDWTFKSYMKAAGMGVLGLIVLMIAFWVLKFIIGWVSDIVSPVNYPLYNRELSGGYASKGMMSDASAPSAPEASINYTENKVPTGIEEKNYEVKSYNVTIESSRIEEDCNGLLASLDAKITKKDNINISKHYCNFTIKVLKWHEQEFITMLQKYDVKDLNSNIINIVKSYVNLADKMDEAKKRLAEVDTLLADSKKNYDELWAMMKNRSVTAESIDSLNKIILNKSELISKFSKERADLIDQINTFSKQKQDYDEQIQYVDFYVAFSEKIILDWESIKDRWYYDYKAFVENMNDTARDLTVNLGSFLLKAFSVSIYVVLGLAFLLLGGKGVYKMGRRIILGKGK